jgi:DNA-binding response OmpR family regulator
MTTRVLNIQQDAQTMLLAHWILSEDGFGVIDALATAPPTITNLMRPDIVVLNTGLEDGEMRACIVALRRLVPGVSIVDVGADAERDTHDTGADQYLNTPFSGGDLIARVRACET